MEVAVKAQVYPAQQRHVIDDESKIGESRRAAQTLANFEFDAHSAGEVAIAATELATNLLRHAGGGELLIQTLGEGEQTTLELLAIDRGPGMADIEHCMADGYSTGGTQGTGLGAVRRLATEFDIYSASGEGTVVMARFGSRQPIDFGAVSVPMPGELDCGDAWQVMHDAGTTAVMVVDGLGHGTFAAEAAQTGVGAFLQGPMDEPMEILTRANRAMSQTRGGAGACARFTHESELAYCGVGNISGHLVAYENSQGLVSHNGTLGMHQRLTRQFEYSRVPGAVLVMHSDGLSARWDLRTRSALLARHPALIAAVLYRDHGRNRDDATVVVVAT